MNSSFIFLLVVLIGLIVLTRLQSEAYAPNDEARALVALEDPETRRYLVEGLEQDMLDNMLTHFYDSDLLKAYLNIGADPKFAILSFIREFDGNNRKYHDTRNKIKIMESSLNRGGITDAESARLEREIARDRMRVERLDKQLDIQRKNIGNLYILVDGYFDNRINRRGKNYLPFKRNELLQLLNWLLNDDQEERTEQLILIENIHPNKFSYTQQREHEGEMDYLREYWKNRQAITREVLTEKLPKDLVGLTKKYMTQKGRI